MGWKAPSGIERFVHGQNLAHYLDLLEYETNPGQRQRLLDLLIEEENRFGERREKARDADLLIAKSKARVVEQTHLLARLENDGHDTALAQRTLDNMVGLLAALVTFRDDHLTDPGPDVP